MSLQADALTALDRVLDGRGTGGDVARVLGAADQWKPAPERGVDGATLYRYDGTSIVLSDRASTYDIEAATRHLYYVGRMSDDLRKILKVRFPNTHADMDPFAVNLVRKVVNRLSTVYLNPSRRALRLDGDALDALDPRSRSMTAAYRAARFDSVQRGHERHVTLFRTNFERFYVDDLRRRIVVRKFAPYLVHRLCCADFPEDIDRDFGILLQINSPDGVRSSGDRRCYEAWRRLGTEGEAGTTSGWRTARVRGDGTLLTEPADYGLRDGAGRPLLPLLVGYDEEPDGQAFLDGGHELLMVARAINVRLTDLQEIIQTQAYDEMVWKSSRPLPKVTGPRVTHPLGPEDSLSAITKNPKIREVQDLLSWLLFYFGVTSDLPPSEFSQTAQALNSMALRVQERPLLERRSMSVELRAEEERRAFEIMRALHNDRAVAWRTGVEIPLDAELEWEPGALSGAIDPVEVQTRHLKDQAVGLGDAIGYIMERDGVDEETAVRTYETVQARRKRYPPAIPTGTVGPDGTVVPVDGQPASSVHQHTTTAAVAKAAGEPANGAATGGGAVKSKAHAAGITEIPIPITPTDLARVVRVNEVRERLGLGEMADGDRTVAEVAAEMEAEAERRAPTAEDTED